MKIRGREGGKELRRYVLGDEGNGEGGRGITRNFQDPKFSQFSKGNCKNTGREGMGWGRLDTGR